MLIKTDVSLSYKLLKFINSLSFGFYSRSIPLSRPWCCWVKIYKNGFPGLSQKHRENKPDELIITAICRARFCELIASAVGLKDRSSDLL